MQALNNIFMTAGEPVKRFVKTVEYPVTGWRIDPENNNRQVEFVLSSPHKEFQYDNEVLEIYSDKELKFFMQRNRYLIEAGLVKEFTGEPDEVDMKNALTDAEVLTLASTRLPNDLKGKLKEYTSPVTIKRVLATAQEIGRPAKVIEIINERLAQLST